MGCQGQTDIEINNCNIGEKYLTAKGKNAERECQNKEKEQHPWWKFP